MRKVERDNDAELEEEAKASGAPACPCCSLHVDIVTMEDHLLCDHSPSELVGSLLAYAIIYKNKVK